MHLRNKHAHGADPDAETRPVMKEHYGTLQSGAIQSGEWRKSARLAV